MKRVIIALLAAACTCVFSGCNENASDDNTVSDKITLSEDEIKAGPDGKSAEITVTSSGDWRIAGMSDWARPSALSGKNGDKVTFTVDPNTVGVDQETIFKIFTGSAIAPLKIVSTGGDILELISDSEESFGRRASSFKVRLNTNIDDLDYTLSGDGDEWITFQERGTDLFGNVALGFTISENTEFESRLTTLTITGLGMDVTVDIEQAQVDFIEVTETDFEFDLSERTLSFDVETNFELIITHPAWMERIETRGVETNTLNFKLLAASGSRVGKIVIKGGEPAPVEITVIQLDPAAALVDIPDAAFRSKLISLGYVLELGTSVIVTEDGLNATVLYANPSSWSDPQITSIEGIEHFPNLESINLSSNALTDIDISALTKVSQLLFDENGVSVLKLGDNPIINLNPLNLYHYNYNTWSFVNPRSFTISSTKLESLDIPERYAYYDEMEWIDVSECPALKKFLAQRATGVLRTVYLKAGQDIPQMEYTAGAVIEYR